MKIKFLKSPTGKFRLAYNIGDEADIENELAKKCIKEGFAMPVEKAPSTQKKTSNKKAPSAKKKPLEKMTKAELTKIAEGLELEIAEGSTNDDIVTLIKEAQSAKK